MENHGTPWHRRWKIVRERIEAMKAIWAAEEASYEGEFVNFERIWSWPKPVQKPHPPIYVGGDAPGTFKRVLRYGDGWIRLRLAAHMTATRLSLNAKRTRGISAGGEPRTLSDYDERDAARPCSHRNAGSGGSHSVPLRVKVGTR